MTRAEGWKYTETSSGLGKVSCEVRRGTFYDLFIFMCNCSETGLKTSIKLFIKRSHYFFIFIFRVSLIIVITSCIVSPTIPTTTTSRVLVDKEVWWWLHTSAYSYYGRHLNGKCEKCTAAQVTTGALLILPNVWERGAVYYKIAIIHNWKCSNSLQLQ